MPSAANASFTQLSTYEVFLDARQKLFYSFSGWDRYTYPHMGPYSGTIWPHKHVPEFWPAVALYAAPPCRWFFLRVTIYREVGTLRISVIATSETAYSQKFCWTPSLKSSALSSCCGKPAKKLLHRFLMSQNQRTGDKYMYLPCKFSIISYVPQQP